MNNSQITQSILTVSDKHIDVTKDLQTEQTKSIAKLIEEKDEAQEEKDQPTISG